MSAKETIKRIVDSFNSKPQLKDKTREMGQGLMLGASLADDANELSKDVQAQVDQLVIEGDSSVEAAQARVDGNGKSYTTLKKRLDEKEQETTAQFAQIAINVKSFGAKGDGITDDYNAIVAALIYMNYVGVLYFPKGIYNISKSIQIGNGFLAQNLKIVGETSQSTRINKTTNEKDVDGKNSVFYMNGLRLHVDSIGISGLGFKNDELGFNLKQFHTFSSIKNVQATNFQTVFRIDNVYLSVIEEIHVVSCAQVVDFTTSQKTTLTLDKIWGENIGRFGLVQSLNYSHFGTIACDWVNVPFPENPYVEAVTWTNSESVYDFLLCTGITIDVLASENCNAKSFIRNGASSLNISIVRNVNFKNTTTTKIKTSANVEHVPLYTINKDHGIKKSHIGIIECNNPEYITCVIFNDYRSSVYGSKTLPYLTVEHMPNAYPLAFVEFIETCNSYIMLEYPGSLYPIFWDKTRSDPTAKPYRITVNTSGQVVMNVVQFYYI